MLKAAFVIAGSASALGLAALAAAQGSTDDDFMPISEVDQNWYLQRSTCTLAHSVNGNSPKVVRLVMGMGTALEFVDPALRNIRPGSSANFTVAIDDATEETYGVALVEESRAGYRLSLSDEMLDRIGSGRRLEARSQGRALLRLDLDNAAMAMNAMRTCQEMATNGAAGAMESSLNESMDAESAARNAIEATEGATPNAM